MTLRARSWALALLLGILASCTCPGSGCPDGGGELAPAADLAPERCGQQGYCPGAGRCCVGGYCETCAAPALLITISRCGAAPTR